MEGHHTKKAKPNSNKVITFFEDDYGQVNPRHADALVVKLDIADQDVIKVLIDNGFLVDILYYHTYYRMLYIPFFCSINTENTKQSKF